MLSLMGHEKFLQKCSTKLVFLKNVRCLSSNQSDGVMYVFDRKAKLLHRERAAQAAESHVFDYVKDEIGYRLADRVFDIKRKFGVVLDLGCGKGHIAKNIYNDSVEKLIVADMSASMVDKVETNEGIVLEKLVTDEEEFELQPNSLDLVVSSLSLHWVNNLPGCLSRIINCLKCDGAFIGAVFGGDTLYELRGSLQLAELEREGGVSPHISPFVDIRDIGGLLNRAGFTLLTIDTDEMVVGYPSMFELMWDLKGMAENNANLKRKLHLKRDTLMAAGAIYNELYGKVKEDGTKYVPATFQVIYMLGWKPDPSQPKPKQRGSGQVSLKDLPNLDQIIKDSKKKS